MQIVCYCVLPVLAFFIFAVDWYQRDRPVRRAAVRFFVRSHQNGAAQRCVCQSVKRLVARICMVHVDCMNHHIRAVSLIFSDKFTIV